MEIGKKSGPSIEVQGKWLCVAKEKNKCMIRESGVVSLIGCLYLDEIR
jgi:hypothetical protein